MTDPAAPAPPPAAVSAMAREVRWQLSKRTRRAGRRMAARLTPRGRNTRGAPSFDVEAPSEAVLAIAGFGSFGAPFGLVPTLAAARALERPADAGAAGSQGASHSLASLWNPATFQDLGIPSPKLSKPLQRASRTLPPPSTRFQTLPKISKNFRASATRRDGGPIRPWAGRRQSALFHRHRCRGPSGAPS